MKSKTNIDKATSRRRGFGLVELMTAIAVLAVITAIAVPAFSGASESAELRRCQRIAQEYATLAGNANAAGSLELLDCASVAQALEKLSNGVYGSGVFEGTMFRLPNVSLHDMTEAAHHLTLMTGGSLAYSPVEPHG